MQNLGLEIISAARRHNEAMALRHQRDGIWHNTTYAQFAEAIESFAAGLLEFGIKPGDRVGIFAPNLPQWLIADYAALSIRVVTVPVYATNTGEQLSVIVNDSKMRLLLVGTGKEIPAALEALDTCDELEQLVLMQGDPAEFNNTCLPFSQFLPDEIAPETRQKMETIRRDCDSHDLATIIYTSGTTGQPKGVQLQHRNFVNQHSTIDERFDVNPSDTSLCFLPLSHVYERTWSAYVHLKGACNAVLSTPKDVVTTLPAVRPTVMVSAPRLYDKIHAAIMTKAESAPPIRRKLFHWALGVGEEYWTGHFAGHKPGRKLEMRYKLADKLVLTKVRNVLGGPKNFLSSGGASLDRNVEDFFLKVGLLICQGYGLTETAPMLTCNSPGDFKFGTVGKPVNDVQMRIDPESGEIQVKGPNVTSGYFGMPEATAESFTEGWFRTGDVGHIDEDGFLVITDRIKDLIITSGGKNVAPQRIETLVGKDHYIDQLAVIGDKQKFISAIIVPAFENLAEFAKQRKLSFRNHEDLIRMPEVVELYSKRIREQSANLAPFEKIRRFTLVAKEFSQQAGEITPTLKVRRNVIAEKYRSIIERMYTGEETR